VTLMGTDADRHPVGARLDLDPDYVVAEVHRTGRAARFDTDDPAAPDMPEVIRGEGVRSALASPIVVEGELWGAITTASRERRLAAGMERRLAGFTDLVATAIANVQARDEVERLAEEQAALRRLATLVAEGASPSAVMDAVAAEMERALGADASMLLRYEPDEEATVFARRVPNQRALAPGTRISHAGDNVTAMVRRTGRPARIDGYRRARGPIAEIARAAEPDIGAGVGAPIVVDRRLWGVIIAGWHAGRSAPDDAEERMVKFAELLETAIANADSRDQLISSRARVLSAGDEARRRVVRDLHDGAQQRLVNTIVMLKLAQRASQDENRTAKSRLGDALEQAEQANRELRELAHGIMPAVLTRGGLRAGVKAVLARLDLPVRVDLPAERLPAEIEANAYFIVAEALTNVVKHSNAGRAEVTASVEDAMLRIEVRDNGTGGADPDGHGLVGMRDRVTTLGGRLEIQSPASGGTIVAATLPLSAG